MNVDAGGKAGATVNLPHVPVLTAPPNQTEVAYPDLQQGVTLLVWNSVPGANGYRVMVDFSPSFARPLYDRQGVHATQLELRALDAGSYYWKVAAVDCAGGEGGFSELWRFALAKTAAERGRAAAARDRGGRAQGQHPARAAGAPRPAPALTLNGERLEVQPDGSFSEFVTFDGGADATVVVKATSPRGGVAEQRRRVTVGQLRPARLTRIAVFGGRTLRSRLKRSRALEYEFVGARQPGRIVGTPRATPRRCIPLGATSTPKQVASARRVLPGRPLGGVAVRPNERALRRIAQLEIDFVVEAWSRSDPPPEAVLAHLRGPRRPSRTKGERRPEGTA